MSDGDIKHPDPERWWARKFILACSCLVFAGIVYLFGLIGGYSQSFTMAGVWAFLVPMLAYLGLAEANNTVNTIWRRDK